MQRNAQLVETKQQLEHRVADLKLLFELEAAMTVTSTMEELACAVVGEAARACDAPRGALLVEEHDTGLWLYSVGIEPPRESEAPPPGLPRADAHRDRPRRLAHWSPEPVPSATRESSAGQWPTT